MTDPAGNFIEDTFDPLNRNTARDVTLVSGFNDTTTESRTFDALNRLTENEDDDYRVTYTYGVRGLSSTVYEETQEYATGTAYTKTVTTKYDAAGNRTSQVYPSGLALTYAYNDINALSSVTDGTNTIASFTYIGFRPKVTTFGSGATQTNTYGGFREDLTTVHHETSAPATLVRMDYGYNKVHDRTYERFGASGSAGDAFEYDKARRLTKAWMGSSTPASPSGNTYVQTIAYNMDDDGNRSSVVVTPYGVSPTTTSYSANNLNQYTAVGGTSQSHDANGNLANNGTLTFKYNYKNLITEVRQSSGGALVAEYLYDANGRRVVKNVNGGVFERYIYAGVETISVLDGSQAWKQDFVFDVTGIDRILMLEQADVLDQDSDSNTTELTRSYYHRNALGSVMEISTTSQTEAASYRYTPYGAVTITRGGSVQSRDPLGQNWAYTSRCYDAELMLHYFRARAQDPMTGRFSQRDPVGFAAGASLFAYALCNPIVWRDPMGLYSMSGVVDDLLAVPEVLLMDWGIGMIAAVLQANAAGSAYGDINGEGPANAIRHCVWMCYVARYYGPVTAQSLGDAHEKRDRGAGMLADKVNNACGIDCAVGSKSCEECCRERLFAATAQGAALAFLSEVGDDRNKDVLCADGEPFPASPSQEHQLSECLRVHGDKGLELWKKRHRWKCKRTLIDARDRCESGDD